MFAIVYGRLARLMRSVNALGTDVEIVIHPAAEGAGEIRSTRLRGKRAGDEEAE